MTKTQFTIRVLLEEFNKSKEYKESLYKFALNLKPMCKILRDLYEKSENPTDNEADFKAFVVNNEQYNSAYKKSDDYLNNFMLYLVNMPED